jgi:hypothetical protein
MKLRPAWSHPADVSPWREATKSTHHTSSNGASDSQREPIEIPLEPTEDSLNILGWVATPSTGSPGTQTSRSNADGLSEILADVDEHLRSGSFAQDYISTGTTTRAELYRYLQEVVKVHESQKPTANSHEAIETSIAIFNAADTIFRFFLPGDIDSPCVGKFWGSIAAITIVSIHLVQG